MLIWNGTTWVVPNAPAQNPTGLELITTGTLSGSSRNFVGCFTPEYDNFKIVLSSVQTSANADIYFNFLSGSTAATSGDYSFAYLGWRVDGVAFNANNGAATLGYTGISQNGVANTPLGNASMDVYSPRLAQRTFITSAAIGYVTNWYSRNGQSHFNLSTAFDGIQFLTAGAPTMGGNVSVYGYRK
jgi:hypothetical protein